MRAIILFIFLSPAFTQLFAQTDTAAVNKDTVLVKGMYRTYKEYLANAPSLQPDFTTTLFTAGKNDTTVIAAEFTLINSPEMEEDIWGFCDGKNVYVALGNFFTLHYWKLQCRGPNPFFYQYKKTILVPYSPLALIGTAASTFLPPTDHLMYVNKTGRTQTPFRSDVKFLIKEYPALFAEFKKESDRFDRIAEKYLLKYNELKMADSNRSGNK